jgi:hypothetical protein
MLAAAAGFFVGMMFVVWRETADARSLPAAYRSNRRRRRR